jgi:hypothetical protein
MHGVACETNGGVVGEANKQKARRLIFICRKTKRRAGPARRGKGLRE